MTTATTAPVLPRPRTEGLTRPALAWMVTGPTGQVSAASHGDAHVAADRMRAQSPGAPVVVHLWENGGWVLHSRGQDLP